MQWQDTVILQCFAWCTVWAPLRSYLRVKKLNSNSQGQHRTSITTFYWFQSSHAMHDHFQTAANSHRMWPQYEAGHILHSIATFIFVLSFYFSYFFEDFSFTSTQVTNVGCTVVHNRFLLRTHFFNMTRSATDRCALAQVFFTRTLSCSLLSAESVSV